MNDELDLNKVTANFIQQNFEKFLETAKGILKGGVDKIRLRLDSTYSQYLSSVLEKYSKAKSFLLRGEPVPLYQFYIPLHIGSQKILLKSPTLSDIQKISSHVIITGSAGCGKSMMMRHLLLSSIIAMDKVPIFLELRQFNTINTDLINLIKQVLRLNKFNLSEDYIDKALAAGHFVLLLDGYDEVVSVKRSQVANDIDCFVKKYGNNVVIISSRPDRELDGWQDFTSLQIQALSLDQARKLIDKVPYDTDLKKKFLDDLRSSLFEKHKSFLSNPLLLSIMLLTYGQSANIPNKLNVFYNQAYEALFERHDALKCGYKRNRFTALDIQDFGRLFAAFCLQAYDKRQFEFDRIQALEYIEKSQQITGLTCQKDNYLKDLIQAVCLLVEEGLHIVYSHRSFQEYFVAKFIADARPEIQKQLIVKYSQISRNDSVFHLLYEIRPDIIEQYYLIPGIDFMFKEIGIKKVINKTHYIKFMKNSFTGLSYSGNSYSLFGSPRSHIFVDLAVFALNHCRHLVKSSIIDGASRMNHQTIIDKYFVGKKSGDIQFKTDPQADMLLSELAKSNGFFTLDILSTLKKIREALKRKVMIEEKSLEEILSSSHNSAVKL